MPTYLSLFLYLARELYEELRQMSVEAGGSIENLMEGINTSNESISSIIPFEKREELSRFELTLKQMIDEAKQMAATPSGSEEDIYASLHKSPSVSSFCPQCTGEQYDPQYF